MGELGDILEVVALSRRRWTTVHATVTQSVHHERQRTAMERSQPTFALQHSTPPGETWVRRSAEKPERSTTVQLWARGAAQLRVEAPAPFDDDDVATLSDQRRFTLDSTDIRGDSRSHHDHWVPNARPCGMADDSGPRRNRYRPRPHPSGPWRAGRSIHFAGGTEAGG